MARQKEDGGRTYRLKETQQSYQLDVKCSPCFGFNFKPGCKERNFKIRRWLLEMFERTVKEKIQLG